MTLLNHLGHRRPSTVRRASLASLLLASAGVLLPASEAHAQIYLGAPTIANQTYETTTNVANAKAALQAFLAGQGAQVAGGESFQRSLNTAGGMMWHDANSVEMILDYYEATLAAGAPDNSFNYVVQDYEQYNPREPFSVAGYIDPLHAGWWGWIIDPVGEIIGRGVIDPAIAAAITAAGFTIDPSSLDVVNVANDDVLWWVLAFIRAYDDLHDSTYLTTAESTFASVCQSWNANPSCNGGVIWGDKASPSYLNAITNELFLQAATKLAMRDPGHGNACGTSPGVVPSGRIDVAQNFSGYYPCATAPSGLACSSVSLPDTYEGWAYAEYQWFNHYFLGSLPISDGLTSNCNLSGSAWTYNQGPIIGALYDLSQMSAGDQGIAQYIDPSVTAQFLPQAEAIALTVLQQPAPTSTQFGLVGGVLTESCDATAQSCFDSIDRPEFKGVFTRYLGHFTSSLANSGSGTTQPVDYNAPAPITSDPGMFAYDLGLFLNQNATTLWNNRTPPAYFPEDWGIALNGGFYGPSLAQPIDTSALDTVVSAMWLPNEPACEGGSYCGATCCGSGNTCTSTNQCCPPGQVNSDGTCCPQYTFADNGLCCGLGEVNLNGACCASSDVCGAACGCSSGTTCSGSGTSASSGTCVSIPTCSSGTFVCGTTCCASSLQVCAPTFDGTGSPNGVGCSASCPPGYSETAASTCNQNIP